MKKKLCATASLALLMSPLHAMEIEENKSMENKSIKLNGNKASTIHNRLQRDHYLEKGLDLNAAPFAVKVVNEDPEASHDNEDATIEDFRSVRDIYRRLAIKDPDYYLGDATSFAEAVTSLEEAMVKDYIVVRDLYLKQGNYKDAAYL